MWIYWLNILMAVIATAVLRTEIEFLRDTGLLSVGVFLIAYVVFWLLSGIYSPSHFRKVPRMIFLFLYFVKELIKTNLRITYEVLTPTDRLHPAVITVPLEVETDLEIVLLANMITLTPGTLSLDISKDKKNLYVHTLYSEKDHETFRRTIKEGLEKKILAIRNS